MTEFDYHVIALVPPEPPFDVQHAIEVLSSQGYHAERAEGPIRSASACCKAMAGASLRGWKTTTRRAR
jgi:hypothetical protein